MRKIHQTFLSEAELYQAITNWLAQRSEQHSRVVIQFNISVDRERLLKEDSNQEVIRVSRVV